MPSDSHRRINNSNGNVSTCVRGVQRRCQRDGDGLTVLSCRGWRAICCIYGMASGEVESSIGIVLSGTSRIDSLPSDTLTRSAGSACHACDSGYAGCPRHARDSGHSGHACDSGHARCADSRSSSRYAACSSTTSPSYTTCSSGSSCHASSGHARDSGHACDSGYARRADGSSSSWYTGTTRSTSTTGRTCSSAGPRRASLTCASSPAGEVDLVPIVLVVEIYNACKSIYIPLTFSSTAMRWSLTRRQASNQSSHILKTSGLTLHHRDEVWSLTCD